MHNTLICYDCYYDILLGIKTEFRLFKKKVLILPTKVHVLTRCGPYWQLLPFALSGQCGENVLEYVCQCNTAKLLT